MKIIDERPVKQTKSFGELEIGTVFEYGGIVHMKLQAININASTVANTVNLRNGAVVYFSSNELVVILSCKLIIEG